MCQSCSFRLAQFNVSPLRGNIMLVTLNVLSRGTDFPINASGCIYCKATCQTGSIECFLSEKDSSVFRHECTVFWNHCCVMQGKLKSCDLFGQKRKVTVLGWHWEISGLAGRIPITVCSSVMDSAQESANRSLLKAYFRLKPWRAQGSAFLWPILVWSASSLEAQWLRLALLYLQLFLWVWRRDKI